jgi:hypothetical protein
VTESAVVVESASKVSAIVVKAAVMIKSAPATAVELGVYVIPAIPWTYADKVAIREPPWPPISVGSAFIGRIVVVSVAAQRRRTANLHAN